jgi:hypothetical protein
MCLFMCLLRYVSATIYLAVKDVYLNSDFREKVLLSVQVGQVHLSRLVSVSAMKAFDVAEA